MGKGRRGGHAGRPTGSGTNFEKEFQDTQKQRRYNFAMDVARDTLNQTEACEECGGTAKCINAAVIVGFGARAWWKCADCGREYTKEISPEKMEQYYQAALAKKNGWPAPEASADEDGAMC
jgi:uncharacterized protein with PIN domain